MADEKTGKRFRARKLGVGGTIGEFERAGKPDVKVGWKAGILGGAGRGSPRANKRGRGGKAGRLRMKADTAGIGLGVKW